MVKKIKLDLSSDPIKSDLSGDQIKSNLSGDQIKSDQVKFFSHYLIRFELMSCQ